VNEKDLVELWNDKRRQLIQAQLHSVIALSVITVLVLFRAFIQAPPYVAIFAIAASSTYLTLTQALMAVFSVALLVAFVLVAFL
jgi:hypothetical protein